LFLPMTHQFVHEDKATAETIAQKYPDLAERMPIILGGHEHTAMVEKAGKSEIVKMGEDAALIGIVDIWWTASGELKSALTQVEAVSFGEDSSAKAFKAKQDKQLTDLMSQPLFRLSEHTSSKQVRKAPSDIASHLLGLVKRGLKNEEVEIVILNAGNIRGQKDYVPGPFLVEDLYKEHPWENEMAIVKLPGQVLKDLVKQSRSGAGELPGYLHCDPDAKISEDGELLEIYSEAVVPERVYTAAILVHLLTGMDSLQPLLDHVRESGLQVPDVECCKPTKFVILQLCMRDAWRKLIGLPSWEGDINNQVNEEDVDKKVTQAFASLDVNGDGTISKEECLTWLKSKEVPLVGLMFSTIDANKDGKISQPEIRRMAFH